MFFAGLAGSLGRNLAANRAEDTRLAEERQARENTILQHLSTADDPEIAALGVSGLLDQTLNRPRKGSGLLKFLSEQEGNPALPKIRDLMAQTRTVQTEPGGATAQPAPPPAPGTAGSMVQPVAAAGSANTPPPMNVAAVEQGPEASLPIGPGSMGGMVPAGQSVTTQPHAHPFLTPQEKVRATQKNEILGKFEGVQAAMGGGQVDPVTAARLTGTRVGQSTDASGNVHMIVGSTEVPVNTVGDGPIGKPSALEAGIAEEAKGIMLASVNSGVPMTLDQATAQAHVNRATALRAKQFTAELGPALAQAHLTQAQQSTLTQVQRLESLKATTAATWQRVMGTTPMTQQQALTTAATVLGPNTDLATVGAFADSLRTQSGVGAGGVLTPPPTAGAATPSTPRGAAAGAGAPPSATATLGGNAPPPGPASRAVSNAGVAGNVRSPKYFSAQGRQTMQAILSVEKLLPKIEATIKQAGLENDNNPIPEKVASLLYGLGISPGADMEAMLQNAGMSKAYGLRGLLGGRSNQQLQGIYGQHLVDQGDSPKLILEKIRTLRDNIPDIKSAVDESENMRVGGRPATGGSPTSSPPVATHPEGTPGTLNGKPVIWKTIGGQSGWVPAAP